jgi:hypothetical protein
MRILSAEEPRVTVDEGHHAYAAAHARAIIGHERIISPRTCGGDDDGSVVFLSPEGVKKIRLTTAGYSS